MLSIMVTGVSGFVGKHLVRELTARNIKVVGVGIEPKAHTEIASQLHDYYQCDLVDPKQVSKLPLGKVDSVINLAGFAAVGSSFDQPDLYMKINVGVLSAMGERFAKEGLRGRILAISTGAVYKAKQKLPLKEDVSGTDPKSSPYAASKLAMEASAHRLKSAGVDCIVVRPFNHMGPGQAPGFLLPDLFEKISKLPKNKQEMPVGNLKTKRDYTDVRDVVRAYVDLATAKGLRHNTYNVCSGRSVSGESILELLQSSMGTHVEPVISKKLFRPSDAPELFGDNSRLIEDTEWKPLIKLSETINDFVKAKG